VVSFYGIGISDRLAGASGKWDFRSSIRVGPPIAGVPCGSFFSWCPLNGPSSWRKVSSKPMGHCSVFSLEHLCVFRIYTERV
jgi:hypothetical protein